MPKSIPDRWLQYKPYGTVIDGTNILALKVPLKDTVARNLSESQRFTPSMLMKQFPKLKFIIDLTNTDRYYLPKDFKNAGINYKKIMIPGKEVPPLEGVKRFCKVMDDFKSAARSDELIGVHCTHGINRTGYLICRYLVQQLGWEPQASVKAFENARGYPIERTAYVTELMKVPRTKLDVSKVNLRMSGGTSKHQRRKLPLMTRSMGPSSFDVRPRFANGPSFPPRPPHQPFGYVGPLPPRPFGPRPPIISSHPPPPPSRWLDGPRPHAYGMLPIRPRGPPGPFHGPCFPSRISGPLGMPGPPRLPPPNIGPPSRMPVPGMAPSRLPPPGMSSSRMRTPRISNVRRSLEHLKCEVAGRGSFRHNLKMKTPGVTHGAVRDGTVAKISKDLDFTVDTFDENLTTTVGS